MDAEKYSKYITQMIESPERAAEIGTTFLSDIQADAAAFESQRQDLEGLTQENSDLRQSNIKLFLQITGQRQDEDEGEELSLEEFAKNM